MVSIEDQEHIIRVPIATGNEANSGSQDHHEYVVRGLRPDEVRRWADFCASVFAYKSDPPPAEYFYRHYANDPNTSTLGSSKLIRVAVLGDDIVASCRIFLRTISVAHSSYRSSTENNSEPSCIHAGGIGEVCTAIEHRRRGLSTKLLENAIAIMEDRADFQVSSLHAAPTFFPLYESMGYSAPPHSNPPGGNRWSTVDFGWTGAVFRAVSRNSNHGDDTIPVGGNENLRLRPAEFPRDTDILQELHTRYSERRFAGCILRSADYWNNYLSKELEGSLWVLESGSQILAWLSLKPSKGGAGDCHPPFEVQEFGMDTLLVQTLSLAKGFVVGVLAAHAIREPIGEGANGTTETIVSLRLPGFLAGEIQSCTNSSEIVNESRFWFDWSSSSSTVDRGWMYRSLGSSAATDGFLDFIRGTNQDATKKESSTREHFVWPSDSF